MTFREELRQTIGVREELLGWKDDFGELMNEENERKKGGRCSTHGQKSVKYQ